MGGQPDGPARRPVDAIVVGAGVIGLTTAIVLAEAGLTVRIRAALPPHGTVSALASAIIGPAFAAPSERVAGWERVTTAELTGGASIPGVHLCRGRLIAGPADVTPPAAEAMAGYQPCAPTEMPAGHGTGFWLRLPLVDMPRYLDHLVERFQGLGGELEIRPVRELNELAEEAPLLANCAGLGARTLAGDMDVRPLRGPRVVVSNPGLDTFLMQAPTGASWASIVPHGDHVVLGGATAVDWDMTPKPGEAEAVLARCAVLEPRLRTARILDFQVGLRPGRSQVRLELERIGAARCVHNYGHAGFGVTVSWGCAREAAALLLGRS
jgi:D-amino-acid oxidase